MYDLRAIMTKAWAMVRRDRARSSLPFRDLLRQAMRLAWAMARHEARNRAVPAQNPVAKAIRAQIVALENVDRLGHAGIERLSALSAELRAAA